MALEGWSVALTLPHHPPETVNLGLRDPSNNKDELLPNRHQIQLRNRPARPPDVCLRHRFQRQETPAPDAQAALRMNQ